MTAIDAGRPAVEPNNLERYRKPDPFARHALVQS
jgi:hypothetical protein